MCTFHVQVCSVSCAQPISASDSAFSRYGTDRTQKLKWYQNTPRDRLIPGKEAGCFLETDTEGIALT